MQMRYLQRERDWHPPPLAPAGGSPPMPVHVQRQTRAQRQAQRPQPAHQRPIPPPQQPSYAGHAWAFPPQLEPLRPQRGLQMLRRQQARPPYGDVPPFWQPARRPPRWPPQPQSPPWCAWFAWASQPHQRRTRQRPLWVQSNRFQSS